MELFYSLITRKFNFFESDDSFKKFKDPRTKHSDYEFYQNLGFNPDKKSQSNPNIAIKHYKTKDEVESYIKRLECYTTLLYGALSCDISYQLRNFPQFVEKYELGQGQSLDYQYMYFNSVKNIMKFAPITLQPLILKQWLMVSSDQFESNRNKMLMICQVMMTKTLPTLQKTFNSATYSYSKYFKGEHFDIEFKAALIALKKELEAVTTKGRIKDKYTLFDPQYR